MERLAVENHVFHRACFKCHSCSAQLKPGSYEFDGVSGQFYCRTHHRDLLRQRNIKRTIDQRNTASPTGGEGEEGEPKRKKGDVHREVTGSKVVTSTTGGGGGAGGSTKSEATPTSPVLATPTDVSRSPLPSVPKTALVNGSVVTSGLPQQQLSGQRIATEKIEEKERVKVQQQGKEGEGEKEEEVEEDVAPVKPPRRRTTKKSSAPQVSLPRVEETVAPAKVPRGHLALFSCYFYLLCALLVYCTFHGLLSLHSAWNSP